MSTPAGPVAPARPPATGRPTAHRRKILFWLPALTLAWVPAASRAARVDGVARVGMLSWQNTGPYHEAAHAGLMAGLREQGFVEGRNLVMLRREALDDADRFLAHARELAREQVDVFFAPATPMATAAWRASRTTPIVIATIVDPVELQFVKSLGRPGTRVTGVSTMNKELTGKRMQLLAEAIPGLKRLGVIVDEAMRHACQQEIETMDAAARQLGLALTYVHIGGADKVDGAFRTLVGARVQAVLTTLTSTRNGLEREYAEAALRSGLPSMFDSSYGARLGGLLSYGPDIAEVYRRAGHYVGRILKGEQPAEMAIEQPLRFLLAINLGTARRLQLSVPQTLLVRAEEVVE